MSPNAPSEGLVAFARNLRRLRRERELSQEALALRADLHPKHISDIERANKDPRATTVVRLADALGVEVWELFVDAHERPPAARRWREMP